MPQQNTKNASSLCSYLVLFQLIPSAGIFLCTCFLFLFSLLSSQIKTHTHKDTVVFLPFQIPHSSGPVLISSLGSSLADFAALQYLLLILFRKGPTGESEVSDHMSSLHLLTHVNLKRSPHPGCVRRAHVSLSSRSRLARGQTSADDTNR